MDFVAKIPAADLTLEEAASHVEDPAYWVETMPAVLFHFSVADYWQLTVGEHAALVDYLTDRNLYASP